MTLGEKCEVGVKAAVMTVKDHFTEAQLAALKARQGDRRGMRMPEGFDPGRLRLIWPDSYPWPLSRKWLFPLLAEFRRAVRVEFRKMPDFCNAIYFQVEIDGHVIPVAIDTFDKVDINVECAAEVLVYFKMQYARGGYGLANVVPGGFIPAYSELYLHLKKVRELRDRGEFNYDTYGRFGANFARGIRGKAVEILSTQTALGYHGGLGRVSYRQSLLEAARSKVCIDLPGVGPLCFRLIDYLAVGSCVIAYPHQAELHVPLQAGKEIVYCKEDFSDLVDLCEYYVHHDEEREQIARAGRAYFDRNLSRVNLASYYIQRILEFAGVVRPASRI